MLHVWTRWHWRKSTGSRAHAGIPARALGCPSLRAGGRAPFREHPILSRCSALCFFVCPDTSSPFPFPCPLAPCRLLSAPLPLSTWHTIDILYTLQRASTRIFSLVNPLTCCPIYKGDRVNPHCAGEELRLGEERKDTDAV